MGSGASLVTRKLLLPEAAQRLRSWKDSGLNLHQGARLPPEHHAGPEQVAQSLPRNPCSLRESVVDIGQARNKTPCMLTTAGHLFRNLRSLQEDQPPAVGIKSDDWPGTEPA